MKNNHKKRSLFALLLIGALICALFAGCSAARINGDYAVEPGKSLENRTGYDGAIAAPESSESKGNQVPANPNGEKIIEYVTLNVETKTFDDFIAALNSKLAEAGGYVESSDVDGNSLNAVNSRRSARFILRVPAEKKNAFTDYLSQNATVTNRQVRTENVTLEYVDTESRLAALRAEKESLEELLSRAETVNDIIVVREQLTNVIYQIESYQSRLRTYDNLIDYVTVTLNVNEVERTTVVEKQGVFDQIGTNLKNNFSDIGEGFVNFFVWLVSALPYLLLLAVLVLIVILIIRAARRKAAKKRRARMERQAQQTPPPCQPPQPPRGPQQ